MEKIILSIPTWSYSNGLHINTDIFSISFFQSQHGHILTMTKRMFMLDTDILLSIPTWSYSNGTQSTSPSGDSWGLSIPTWSYSNIVCCEDKWVSNEILSIPTWSYSNGE